MSHAARKDVRRVKSGTCPLSASKTAGVTTTRFGHTLNDVSVWVTPGRDS